MEAMHSLLVNVHIAVGAVVLVLFWVPAFAKKGSPLHVNVGKVYVASMYVVVATAFVASLIVLADPIGIRRPGESYGPAESAELAARFRMMSLFLLMLSVLKKLPLHHAALQRGEWLGLSEGLSMRELGGKQVGIVGFGRIGQAVARNVRGFLARVVYHDDRAAPAHIEAELEAKRVSFDALVETSDVVTVHTPLTDATRGLFDRRVFDRMKRTAILVNTARGPVVNQAHLVEALDRASIAGAGLDVFESEPLGADNPLLGRDNVVVTPHNAGTTIDTWTRRLDFAFSNIERVARGEAPHSVVNDG